MNGAFRLHHGQGHERDVADRLRRHGWVVQPWGQGLFPADRAGSAVRAALTSRIPLTHWRWIPDLVAVKDDRVVLVDPKTELGHRATGNFSIELNAYMAHLLMLGLGLPIVYVWQDMTCNTPERLVIRKKFLNPESYGVNGSGTPFALVWRAEQHPFEWAFGSALPLSEEAGA